MQLAAILTILNKRGCDKFGCGSFGSGRGSRKHMGIDYVSKEGEPVFAPIDGLLTFVKPYSTGDKAALEGVNINSSDHRAELYYFAPLRSLFNKNVKKGELIGYAVNMKRFYGEAISNHIHFELFDKVKNQYINFESFFFKLKNYIKVKNLKTIVSAILGVLSFVLLALSYFKWNDKNYKSYRVYLLTFGLLSAVAVPGILYWDWLKSKLTGLFIKK